MTYAIIMAGGSGTRFWPASRAAKPKQFLDLFGNGTMIQETVRRLDGIVSPDRIFVITNRDFTGHVREQLPQVPSENIVAEPIAKNTAPCVALGAALVARRDPDATMLVLPSDHTIEKEDAFRDVLRTAIAQAASAECLVTIGIRPNRPETGYGYIRVDNPTRTEGLNGPVFRVKQFAEKPDLETACSFLASGDYLWNSGMFIWSARSILNAVGEHLPAMAASLHSLGAGLVDGSSTATINRFFEEAQSISVDYGIMERSKNVFVVPGDFGWNDVGSWTAVHELAEKDSSGNAVMAPVVLMDSTRNALVSSNSGKLIALVGLDNIAVVETEDAILVTSLKHAQNVKNITTALKDSLARFR